MIAAVERKPETYKGPCRVPGCLNMAEVRGVCRFCHHEIWQAEKYGRSLLRKKFERLGILTPPHRAGRPFKDRGISIELGNYPLHKWLPSCSRAYFGRPDVYVAVTRNKPVPVWKKNSELKEWEAAVKFANEVNWSEFPAWIKDKFGHLSELELSNIAWRATEFGPGTEERVFVYHLRQMFGVNFLRRGGSILVHADDSRDVGANGTLLVRTAKTVVGGRYSMEEVIDDEFMDDTDD